MIYKHNGIEKLCDEDRPQKVIDFLEKIKALCDEYGFVICHEDTGGAFEIYEKDITDESSDWFMCANYHRREGDQHD